MKRIFYSWQSDAPRKTNHDFIGDSLREAAERVKRSSGQELEVLDGARGEPGTPALADTILSRIAAADIYVADISLVYQVDNSDGKRLSPNPNVAIELGYAIASLSLARVVSVQNEHFGGPAEVPFDLKHLRWPLRYTLQQGVSQQEITKKKSALTRGLQHAIEEILKDDRPREALLAKRTEVALTLAKLVEQNRMWQLALKRHDLGNGDLERKALAITEKVDKLTYNCRKTLARTSEIDVLNHIHHVLGDATLMLAGSPQGTESLALDFAEASKLRSLIERIAAAKERLDRIQQEQAEIDSQLAEREDEVIRLAAEFSESDLPAALPAASEDQGQEH
jgi:hypothetical protein